MVSKNDLYDISFALIMIRGNICKETNIAVLSQIVKVLETETYTEDNQIRKAILSVDNLEKECWGFAQHNNVYVHHQLLNNADVYNLLVKLLRSLICELNQNAFEKAYDLVDSFHCLPEIIANNNFEIPKSFWKIFVRDYRKKWEKDFLRKEQRTLNKKHRGWFCVLK